MASKRRLVAAPTYLARPCVVQRAGLIIGLLLLTGCSLFAQPKPDAASSSPNTVEEPAPPLPASPELSWSDVYQEVNSGVVRIAVVGCESQGTGSGFLIGQDLIATAAHVAEDAASLSVRAGVQVRSADLLGLDSTADLALLRLDEPVSGYVFDWADQDPRVGDDIAAVGYPLGRPLTMTRGAVTAQDRRIEVEGQDRRDLVQTDAAINPGNSGGPLIDETGAAAGVVSAGSDAPGDAYAVSPTVAQETIEQWLQQDEAPPAVTCGSEGPRANPEEQMSLAVEVTSSHPEAPSLAQTFQLYADAINTRDYAVAYGLLTPAVRRGGTVEEYGAKLESSYWIAIELVDVEAIDANSDDVEVHFRTLQDAEFGPDGQTCTDWRVNYRMVLDSGFWQIDKARSLSSPQDCSADLTEGDN